MSKEDQLEFEGEVIETLPNTKFKVKCEGKMELYGQTYQIFALNFPNYIKLIKFFFGLRFLYILLLPLMTLLVFFHFSYTFLILSSITGIYFMLALGYYYLCSKVTEK